MTTLRIQKYMASQDWCSRREAERLIEAGCVYLNGRPVTEMGMMIDPLVDRVEIRRRQSTALQYIAFHKPVGIVSNLPQGNEIEIVALLPPHLAHLSTIGRLDKESEGLILLSDDGVFAKHALSHHHAREYHVTVDIPFTGGMAQRLEGGVMVLGQRTAPVSIQRLDDYSFLIRMREGKNRQIRRMVQKVGASVVRLMRLQYGIINLGDLAPGEFRCLTPGEVASIRGGWDD